MEIVMKKGIYRHYKGGVYELIGTARHSETLEELIIYKNVESGDVWARPAHMWSETVEADGRTVLRFQPVESSEESLAK